MKLQNLLISVFVSGYLVGFVVCNLFDCIHPAREKNELLSAESLQKEFVKINDILVESTTSTDAEQNMKIVEEVLRKAEQSGSLLESKTKKKKFVKAAKMFLSLRELGTERKCNKDGLAILDNVLVSIESQQIPERLAELILHYLKRQDLVCSAIFPAMLNERLAKKDKLKLERLDEVFERSVYIDKLDENRVENLWKEIKEKSIMPRNVIGALKYFYNARPVPADVKRLDLEDDDAGFKKEIKLKFLLEPCRHFTENLGDIYDVASTWVFVHNPDNKQFDFYYNWAKYMFCTYYV